MKIEMKERRKPTTSQSWGMRSTAKPQQLPAPFRMIEDCGFKSRRSQRILVKIAKLGKNCLPLSGLIRNFRWINYNFEDEVFPGWILGAGFWSFYLFHPIVQSDAEAWKAAAAVGHRARALTSRWFLSPGCSCQRLFPLTERSGQDFWMVTNDYFRTKESFLLLWINIDTLKLSSHRWEIDEYRKR